MFRSTIDCEQDHGCEVKDSRQKHAYESTVSEPLQKTEDLKVENEK